MAPVAVGGGAGAGGGACSESESESEPELEPEPEPEPEYAHTLAAGNTSAMRATALTCSLVCSSEKSIAPPARRRLGAADELPAEMQRPHSPRLFNSCGHGHRARASGGQAQSVRKLAF